MKPKLRIRKLRGSDIKWSNLLKDQATHFDGYIESPNADTPFTIVKTQELHLM
jgi:hypothetical protein